MNLQLPEDATRITAIRWLQHLVRDFGLGFHLDCSPEDYSFPTGACVFTPTQCNTLKLSLDHLFAILGGELPYEICADEASVMLAASMGVKPPLEHHDPDFQQQLLRYGSRDDIIEWLCWNDPNGIYTDEASIAEDRLHLTLDRAREIMNEQINRNSEQTLGF